MEVGKRKGEGEGGGWRGEGGGRVAAWQWVFSLLVQLFAGRSGLSDVCRN